MEIIVAVSIFVVIVFISGSLYIMAQRIYDSTEDKMELVQNGRVTFDRLSREVRQSVEIATPLATSSDAANHEILFQNGHDTEDITYVYYFLDNNQIRRAEIAYYFDGEPDNYVRYNSKNSNDDPPQSKTLEDKIVGEYYNGIDFWEDDGLIYASSTLSANKESFQLNTAIYPRN